MRGPQMELVVLSEQDRRNSVDSEDYVMDDGTSGFFSSTKKSGEDDIEEVSAEKTAADYDAEPGNFHLGPHHYTSSGVRYFSSNCQACADYATAIHSGKISQGSKFRLSKPLIKANSKNLAQCHSAIDVQCCSSTTCEHCCTCRRDKGVTSAKRCPIHSKAGSVAFIKTGDATFLCQEVGQKIVSENEENDEDNTKRRARRFGSPRAGSPTGSKKKRGFWSKSK